MDLEAKESGELTRFRTAYQSEYARMWAPELLGDEEALTQRAQLVKLSDGGLGLAEIAELESASGWIWPPIYKEFLNTFGFVALQLALVEFPPTVGEIALISFRSDIQTWKHSGFFPIGRLTDDAGTVGFTTHRSASHGMISVEQSSDAKTSLVGPVFSSFGKMLDVLSCYLEAETEGLVRKRGPAGYEDLIKRLRSSDPDGFGGIGWEVWWGTHLQPPEFDATE